uniref:Uncharacterized protein n=1 Tax=Anguilla anguilla TaxID=7936 RepID=A0A0E9XUX6_ANGAN
MNSKQRVQSQKLIQEQCLGMECIASVAMPGCVYATTTTTTDHDPIGNVTCQQQHWSNKAEKAQFK